MKAIFLSEKTHTTKEEIENETITKLAQALILVAKSMVNEEVKKTNQNNDEPRREK